MKSLRAFIKFIMLFLALAMLVFAGIKLFSQPSVPSAVGYRTLKVTQGKVRSSVGIAGTLSPNRVVDVGSQVSGAVAKLYVDVNENVSAGQVIAEIDRSLPEAQLAQSDSNYRTSLETFKQSERDLERTKALFARDFVARVEVERAEQAVRVAKNSLEVAKAQRDRDQVNLGYATIRSPINGTVISREVNVGQTLAASLSTPTLFRIVEDLSEMRIDASVSESDVALVKPGQDVKFTVEAFQGREFSGKITKLLINPENRMNSVVYRAIVEVSNSERLLLPGMTARVEVVLWEKDNILRLPNAALNFELPAETSVGIGALFTGMTPESSVMEEETPPEGVRFIYVLRNNRPERVAVHVGLSDDRFTEIVGQEIREGDLVVVGLARPPRQ